MEEDSVGGIEVGAKEDLGWTILRTQKEVVPLGPRRGVAPGEVDCGASEDCDVASIARLVRESKAASRWNQGRGGSK